MKRPTIVKTQHYSKSVSATNANYATGTIDVSWSGYTPVGVVQYVGGTNSVDFWITRAVISGNNLNFTVKRASSGTWTTTVEFDVLFISE